MIVVKKNNYLEYKNLKFRCALGKAGIQKKFKEGDKITPKGSYKILSIYYREDRIKKIKCSIRKIKITKQMGWCDDSKSKYYNKQIKVPSKLSHETLYRKDNIYDVVCVINYNINPTLKEKGSAIFLHIARNKYQKTNGCIAVKKTHLIKLLALIKKNTRIKIG
jgi:L,D-peptidoglycan transpeptidase YkuD (ErfK/YbiS/YcfS/YnhG family)